MKLSEIKDIMNQKKGEKISIEKDLNYNMNKLEENKNKLKYAEKARTILDIVAIQTQSQLEYRLNELVSLAQLSVFEEDAYSLNMQFEIKRGKTEAQPMFVRDGKIRKPMRGTGFGPVDIAAFVLRPTLWSLENETIRKRNTFIYDEPFRHLNSVNGNYHIKASKMIKEISKKVNEKNGGIQMIIVTQNDILAESADKIFHVNMKNRKSYLEKIE